MKKVLLFFGLFAFCSLAGADIISNVSVDKKEIKAGKEVVKINIGITQPKDLRISVWKDGKLIRVITDEVPKNIKLESVWNGKDQQGKPVKPGKYIIKVEADEQITLDKTFGENGVISDFISPFTVRVAPDGNVWVLDKGDKYLCKFDKNGKPKNDIEGENKIKIGNATNFVFDKDGFIYISSGHHQMYKMDQKGNILMKYAGYKTVKDEKGRSVHTPETTTWGQVIGLGPDNKLYIWSYDGLSVYNRGFPDFGGYLYKLKSVLPSHPPSIGYTGPSGISNEKTGEIYWLWHTSVLEKFVDTGKEVKRLYAYSKRNKNLPGYLSSPTAAGTNWFGELYIANWGNSRIEKMFDTGGEFKWVKCIGSPGKNIESAEFLGLHDVYVDGDYIYVAEDGERLYNYETKKALDNPGNHRVSRWIKKFKEVKEIEVEVK